MALFVRVAVSAAIAIVVSWVPVERVAACDCAPAELPDAVRDADVAFVGTPVEHVQGAGGRSDQWHWSVEAGRDPETPDRITLAARQADGGNCGVTFGIGERWLVVASVRADTLQANSCQPSRRVDGSDPEAEAIIAEFAPAVELPIPLLAVAAAVASLVVLGAIAFGRERKA